MTFSKTFNVAGTFTYYCNVHLSAMQGTIIVQAAQTGPAVKFAPASGSPFTLDTSPRGVVAGDFNKDGRMDLATANNAGTVSIILNSAGGLTSTTNVGTGLGTNPVAITVADINGDGNLDLATINGATGTILINNGSGVFTAQPAGTLGVTATTGGSGLLNSDASTDLISNSAGASLAPFINDGTGNLTNGTSVTLNSAASAIAIGDINGGGKNDIVVAHAAAGSIGSVLGNGDGTFGPETEKVIGVTTNPSAIALGTFDAGTVLDIAVALAGTKQVAILTGTGTGAFNTAVTKTNAAAPNAIAVGDFNGDGKLDVVTANSGANNISVLMGNGDGTLNAEQNFTVGTTPSGVAVADFNNDGAPDIAVSNQGSSNLIVLLNMGGTNVSVQSNSPNSTVGQSVTFTASVAISVLGSTPAPTGTVTFFDGITQIGAPATLSNGLASTPTSSLTAGVHSITAKYSGDTVYNPHTSAAITQTVKFQTSVTTPGSTKNPSIVGVQVTFSATVNSTGAGATPATGTLSFNDGGSSIGGGTLATTIAPAAAASLSISPSLLGAHSITADYPGDATHTSSSSATLTQTVNQPGAFSASQLDFGNALFSVSTGARNLTLTNNGSSSLSMVTLATSGDFSQTNDCGGALGAGQTCNIALTFTPIALGIRTGSLTLDQADPVSLSGASVDFEVNLARPARPTRDTGAGPQANPRRFAIQVAAPAGTPGEVTFTCDGLPPGAGCSFSPAKVPLDSGTVVELTVRMPLRSRRIAASNAGATFLVNARVGGRVRTLTLPVPSR